MNGLVAAGSEDGGSEDLVGLGITMIFINPASRPFPWRGRPWSARRPISAGCIVLTSSSVKPTAERRVNVDSVGGHAIGGFAWVIVQKNSRRRFQHR